MDKDGNLGIGTSIPSANLHVNHDFHIAPNSSAWGTPGKGLYMRYSTTTTSNGHQDAAYIQSIDRSNYPNSVTRHPLYFEASKYSFSNGNVGIGTSDPSFNLDLTDAGTIRSGSISLFSDSQKVGTTSNTLALFGTNGVGGIGFYTNDTSSHASASMYIQYGGNLSLIHI